MDEGAERRMRRWLDGLTLPQAVEAETRLDSEISRLQRKLTSVRARRIQLAQGHRKGFENV